MLLLGFEPAQLVSMCRSLAAWAIVHLLGVEIYATIKPIAHYSVVLRHYSLEHYSKKANLQ